MKVKSVRRIELAEPVPVYDLTVEGTHNFALAAGVFVHNSKDVADAVCGAVFAATRHPAIRAGIRAVDADGKPIRTPHTMQRPTGQYRPVSKTRPSPSRDRLRDKDLALTAAGDLLPSDPDEIA